MVKVSVEKLLELLKRSGLVEETQLTEIFQEFSSQIANPTPDGPELIATRLVEAKLLTRWQADNLLLGKHKGFFLGKYKLLGHLGRGGMSNVYLAEHVMMKRRVAIKVLPQNKVEDSSYLERFKFEVQAAAALDHPNIVRAYDTDQHEKTYYLVMEYVEGRDLQIIVQEEGPLDYDTAADYIAQVAEGLQHAHDAGLIHRDIKPANCLVDQKSTVKILDMGLAKFSEDDRPSLTIEYNENVLGTADYLAPEQALNSHNVDRRADIYSLGCTFYYVLTGHPPFPEGTLPQRLMMHQTKAPKSIYIDRNDAPEDLVSICSGMMVKSPDERIQSALEVNEKLTRWLTSRGMQIGGRGGSGNLTDAARQARLLVENDENQQTSNGGPRRDPKSHQSTTPPTPTDDSDALTLADEEPSEESSAQSPQASKTQSTGDASAIQLAPPSEIISDAKLHPDRDAATSKTPGDSSPSGEDDSELEAAPERELVFDEDLLNPDRGEAWPSTTIVRKRQGINPWILALVGIGILVLVLFFISLL